MKMQSLRQLVYFSARPRSSFPNITGRCRRYMCTEKKIENRIEKRQMNFVENESASQVTKSGFQINWEQEMEQIIEEEEHEKRRSILAPVEDESKIYAEPMLRPSFNLAAYVQKSETLQQFIKLGVNLNRLDKLNVGQFIANLDFKRDVEAHILLLTKDIGVPIEQLGNFFTKNPRILKESLDDIQVRVNYLELKRFTRDEIVTIITRNPFWLSHSTRDIDERLGFFQKHFRLIGNEVRLLTVSCPKLITYDMVEVQKISFSVREECTFTEDEVRQLVLKCPKIWMMRKCFFCDGKTYHSISIWMKFEQFSHLSNNLQFQIDMT